MEPRRARVRGSRYGPDGRSSARIDAGGDGRRLAGDALADGGEARVIADLVVDLRRDADPQPAIEHHDPGSDAVPLSQSAGKAARRIAIAAVGLQPTGLSRGTAG